MRKFLIVGRDGFSLARMLHERDVDRHWYFDPNRFEAALIMQGAGLEHERILEHAPFRAPHHTCSTLALSYWKDAFVKGDPKLPYVPAARI